MTQETLFDPCAARHQGNAESIEAHAKTCKHKNEDKRRILECLRAFRTSGGLTVEEISIALEMRYTTVSARCAEMKHAGLIRPSGQRRATRSGCKAAVLVEF